MKFAPRDHRSAISVWRLTLALTVAALVPILLYAGIPSWWLERGILVENATADDYAPVNQGQLKNIARAAVAEMDATLSGGAGDELHHLIESWSSSNPATNDFAPVNIGQLKTVAKPFYDRLIAAGLAEQYPWSGASGPPDDFAVANIGQVKNLFRFRMPVITIVSGDRQQALPSHFLIQPLLVRVHDSFGRAAANQLVTFSIVSGGGGVTANRFTHPAASSITLLSDANGLARVDYKLGPAAGMANQIIVTLASSSQTVAFSASTIEIAPLATQVIGAGRSHTLAVYADGTVWSWGENSRGQLGDGSTISRWHRGQVVGLSNIVAVSAFADTSVALRTDGTVWTWGANDEHALGNGGAADSAIPMQVLTAAATPLQNVVGIAAGYSHNLALRADGTVWAWGADWGFQLGNDSENDSPYALQVLMENGGPLQNVTKIACGDGHSLALTRDGTVWAWGYNDNGALLGTGVEDWRSAVPAQVSALTDIVMIVGGELHNAALRSDGSVWTWGDNRHGQLGNGASGGERGAPDRVPGVDQVVSIAAGKHHTLALRSDGSVWAWGQNGSGQVRSGCQPEQIVSPTSAGDFSGAVAIAAGYNQSFSLTTNGLVLGWGLNYDGELGTPAAEVRMFVGPVDDFLLLDDPDHDGVATWSELQVGTDPNAYSSLGDGISNSWKVHFGFSLIDPAVGAQDPTSKGMTLLQDYQMGTDPTRSSTINDGIPDGWKVGHGLPVFYCDLAGTDWIGKGMTVAMDYQFGTDPNKISTMDDGIPDVWKIAHNINPVDPAAAGRDDDGDGLTNLAEYQFGADPENPDSDGDGVIDGEEVYVFFTIVSGTEQQYFLDQAYVPVVVEARNAQGALLKNIPVTLTITRGSGALALTPMVDPPPVSSLNLVTDLDGRATAYFMPKGAGTNSHVTVTPPRGGGITGSNNVGGSVLDPNKDGDSDGLSNKDELELGTNPNNPNTDGDSRLDGDDFWPTSRVFDGPRVPDVNYVAITSGFDRMVMNDAGQVAFVDPTRASLITGTFLRDNFASPTGETAIQSTGFPTLNGDIQLRYAAPWPVDINSQGQVLTFVKGYYEWNPNVPGHSYPPISSNGIPTFFPDDPNHEHHFWPHSDYAHNVLWTGGANVDIPKPPGSYLQPWTVGINDAGTVLMGGVAGYPSLEPGFHVFTWQGGLPTDLGLGTGNKINNHGDIAGVRDGIAGVWLAGAFTAIGPSGKSSVGTSLNNTGQVVGYTVEPGWLEQPWAWKQGEELLKLPGLGRPVAFNDKGQMVNSATLWQNGRAYDLNSKIGGSHPAITSVEKITDSGVIVANLGAVILIPVELMVDANRDGTIDDKDRGKVSEQAPWHFWYNEDNDSGETGGDDIPLGSGQGDFGGGTVSGIRDLVDFFPVFLDIKDLVKVLPPESHIYKLKAEGGAFKFVYTDLTPADSGKYLKDIAAAEVLKAADTTLVGAGSSAALDPAFLNKIKDEGKGVLLIEAGSKTDKPLVLEVYKNSEKRTELKLYVKTDGVEKMFRHKNLLAANGQSGGRGDELGEPPNYPDRLSSDKKFVFVHGYNVNPEQARGWNCEIFKRLFWSGSKAKFHGITWYGSETQVTLPIGGSIASNYQANVDNAFATAQSLTQFINSLDGNVTIAAHSLGNMLVGSAMHDWQATGISNYFMVDAAVPKEAYDPAEEQLSTQTTWGMDHPDWSNYQRRLWCSDWHRLFHTNDNRSSLTWQNRLERVASAYNFYSSGEEVLANPSSAPTVPFSAEEVWNNQERMKGRMESGQVLSSNYGGWRFTNYYNEGQVYYPQIPPAQTTSITDAQLREHPFFWPGSAELYGANGSNYASPEKHRNTLLAEMVPTLSFAAGSNNVSRFGTAQNRNMQTAFQNHWPQERMADDKKRNRWLHSDAREVAFIYVFKLFDAFVETAQLNP